MRALLRLEGDGFVPQPQNRELGIVGQPDCGRAKQLLTCCSNSPALEQRGLERCLAREVIRDSSLHPPLVGCAVALGWILLCYTQDFAILWVSNKLHDWGGRSTTFARSEGPNS